MQRKIGATVVVTGLVEDGVVVLDTEVGSNPIHVSVERGTKLAFHASAHGKIALAYGPRKLLERLPQTLPRLTPHTIVDMRAFEREIAIVRRRGWAAAPEESYPGLTAIAAPIFSSPDRLEGGIGVFGAAQLINTDPASEHIEAVVSTAERISAALGRS